MSLPRLATLDPVTCRYLITDPPNVDFPCFGGSTLGGGGLVFTPTPEPPPGPPSFRLAFMEFKGSNGLSPGDIWSSLDDTKQIVNVKADVNWADNTYAALGLLRADHGDIVDAIIFIDENPSPSINRIDYDGGNESLIVGTGGTNADNPSLMTVFPAGNTEADIAYWHTQRRGWTPLSGIGGANWSSINFDATLMTSHQPSGVDSMIVRNSGVNPFDRRDYKLGTEAASVVGLSFNGGLKSNRQRTKVYGIHSGDFYEITPSTLAFAIQFTMPGIATGLLGVNDSHIYFFDDFGGVTTISRCSLTGANRTVLVDLDAMSITPSILSGVVY